MTEYKRPVITEKGIARVSFKKGKCQIAGAIEGETNKFYKTVKSLQGIIIRHRVQKDKVHFKPCASCPNEEDIKKQWFQPGRDPRDLKSTG